MIAIAKKRIFDCQIREMWLADLPSVMNTQKDSGTFPGTWFDLARVFGDASVRKIVAVHQYSIVGYGLFRDSNDSTALLGDIVVRQELRRQGVGTALLREAMRLSNRQLFLHELPIGNKVGKKFLVACRFRVLDEMKQFFKEVGEDGLLMYLFIRSAHPVRCAA